MATNWITDILGETWASVRDILKGKTDNLAKMDFTGDTNLPNGTVRWNSTTSIFEKWNTTTLVWDPLASLYGINVDKVDGLDASAFAPIGHVGSGSFAHATAGASAGFMSAADKSKLDAATSADTASTLALRDVNGRFSTAAGASGTDVPQAQEVVLLTGAQTIAGAKTFSDAVTAPAGTLIKKFASFPDNGGRLILEKGINSTLAGDAGIDIGTGGFPNQVNIGEFGGIHRGVFFDLTKAAAGLGSDGNFIVAKSLGASGFRKFSDGTIEQWGISATRANIGITEEVAITWPTAFLNNIFTVVAGIEVSDGVFDQFAVFNRATSTLSVGQFVAREVTTAIQSNWKIAFYAIGN